MFVNINQLLISNAKSLNEKTYILPELLVNNY